VPETKAELRARIRATRGARAAEDRANARDELTGRLMAVCREAEAATVAAFLPTKSEPPIDGFLEAAHAAGLTVLTPAARPDHTMQWILFEPHLPQTIGGWGVPELVSSDDVAVDAGYQLSKADVIFVPAAAVDVQGTRLGWGQGFYDRALAGLTETVPTYAVVFDDEVIDHLPREPHDQPVTGAVTPARTVEF
jgi:5-formyltetrahydrofolate cyclo-ligase